GGQRGHRHLAVRVRPGADAHGIDVGRAHDVVPVTLDAADAELLGHALAGLARAVGDRDELDTRLLAQAGNVPAPGVASGAHETHADRSLAHSCPPEGTARHGT